MTAATTAASVTPADVAAGTAIPPAASGLRTAVSDARTIAWRNLKAMSRTPAVIMFSTIQPVIFVITFRYVFGGSIQIPGVDYVQYLMPGIFVQTVAFGGMNTGIGLSEDLHQGLIERFRSLPMARSAVLAGRSLADLVRNALVVLLVFLVGYLVGFRVATGPLQTLAAMGVLLLFSFAFSWIFAWIGLKAPTSEAAQAMSFPVLAILVFASSAFTRLETMPGWLQAYNRVNPVSLTADALRGLLVGDEGMIRPAGTSTAYVLLWAFVIVAVVAPLAVRTYRRVA